MAGSQSGDAYSLLERSFNDIPSLKPHKALPHRRQNGIIFPAAAPVRQPPFADDETASQPSSPNTSPLASPKKVTTQDSGLPPTPPSNFHDNAQRTAFSPPNLQAGGLTPPMAGRSVTNTPNHKRPPTPDMTPPASLTVPPRPSPSHYPSSRPESFITAREEQLSSDGEGSWPNRRSTEDEQDPARKFFEAAKSMKLGKAGLVMKAESSDKGVMSTKEPPPRFELASKVDPGTEEPKKTSLRADAVSKSMSGTLDDIPDREWDTNLMRNVTMRRRKPLRPLAERALPTQDLLPVHTMQKEPGPRDHAESGNSSPQSPVLEKFTGETGWPSEVSRIFDARLRDEDSKRLSTLSASSTIVEAIIIVAPQQQPRRKLRHAGRNLALRRESGSPLDSSSPPSNRTSLNSDELPQRQLTHKRASIGDRKSRDSTGSDMASSITSSAPSEHKKHRLRHTTRKEITPSYNQVSSHEARSDHDPPQAGTRSSSEGDVLPHPSSKASVGGPLSTRSYRRNASSPSSLDSGSPQRRSQKFANCKLATSPRKPADEKFQLEQEQQGTDLTLVPMTGELEQSPGRGHRSLETEEERMDASQDRSVARATHHRTRASLERVPTDELPRMSFDRSTTWTEEHPRASLDRSTLGTGEHAMARHLYAQVTPFSQFSQTSDMHDALEVSEATAISIYPHNNNSLLVVQQVARSNSLPGRQMVTSPPMQPILTIEPSTPPQQFITPASVDSPLKNPRKPPIPPAFKVIPPTPSDGRTPTDEYERQLEVRPPRAPTPPRPVRRLSLVQRARRYSDTFIQPLFSRTSSLRRSNRGSLRRATAVEPEEEEDRNLHPFWRPRGFWDDLSDSEDDDFYPPDGRDGDRLPQGGDTSEVAELQRRDSRLRRAGRRLSEGFKGSGGFMVGNSLGVERQPTNSRRHHVSLPLSLASRHGEESYEAKMRAMRKAKRESRVVKRRSGNSLRESVAASERGLRRSGRTWRRFRGLSGLGMSVQYMGLGGMSGRFREHRQEKRRDEIRRSIGPRFMVEGAKVA